MASRMAQYGVRHGHAAGKAQAMRTNPDVELVGIYEPDAEVRALARDLPAYAGLRWFASAAELLDDPGIAAVAVEGGNAESLGMAMQAIAAGKHIWYDKPAGNDWPIFQRLVADAQDHGLLVQLGYMYRYHEGFRRISEWVRGGLLGEIFSVRAHMSTWLPDRSGGVTTTGREHIAAHRGGIFYDLAGHMLDQVVWLLGRPQHVTAFLRNDASPDLPEFSDNTLGVFEYARAIATVDIAAMEARPPARRFEVFGTRGSAIMEPFEPEPHLYLHLGELHPGTARVAYQPDEWRPRIPGRPGIDAYDQALSSFRSGRNEVAIPEQPRQSLYDRELAAFLATINGRRPPDRTAQHELLVQETLLRATDSGGG